MIEAKVCSANFCLDHIIIRFRRTLYEKIAEYEKEYKANLVRKIAEYEKEYKANLVRKTWFLLSGVQGKPCTKNRRI